VGRIPGLTWGSPFSIGGKAPRTLVVLPESGFQAALPHGKFSILHCSIVALFPRLLLLPSGASREQVNGGRSIRLHRLFSAIFKDITGSPGAAWCGQAGVSIAHCPRSVVPPTSIVGMDLGRTGTSVRKCGWEKEFLFT